MQKKAPADAFRPGLPMFPGKRELFANRGRPTRADRAPLGRWRDRVEHAPRGDLALSVYALRPGDAAYVSVSKKQVHRLTVVSHLVAAVGPHDCPESVRVNAGTGFRRPGGEDWRPGYCSANVEAVSAVAPRVARITALGVDGEARVMEDAEIIVHHYGQYGLVGSSPIDRSGFEYQSRLTRCGAAATRLDQVPDARGAGDWVE